MDNYIKNKKIRFTSGFTLMETLIVIFILGILMTGTTLMLKNILTSSRQDSMGINNIDLARRVANTFVNELRNSANGANGAYPINLASDNEFIFFSTAPIGDGTVSRIRYYISNNTLYRGVTNPTGIPLSYNTSTETTTPILNDLSLGSSPLFYYYDGNYDGNTNPLTQPVNINSIKFVKINLVVLKQVVQNNSSTFTINTGATLRNLKTNLGN